MDIEKLSFKVETFKRFLSNEELQKADRLRIKRQKQQLIIAQAFLRCLLSNYVQRKPNLIHFFQGKFGKPYLKAESNDPNVEFNLSHSNDLITAAICCDNCIGIDVEKMSSGRNFLGISKRFFSTDEFNTLRSLSSEKLMEAFYKCWTRKEAYLKAIGKGIKLPINNFTVSLRPDQPAALLKINNSITKASKWRIVDIKTLPDYTTSLVIKDHSCRIIQKELSFRSDCFLKSFNR